MDPEGTGSYFFGGEGDEMGELENPYVIHVRKPALIKGGKRQIATYVDDDVFDSLQSLSDETGYSKARLMARALQIFLDKVEVRNG